MMRSRIPPGVAATGKILVSLGVAAALVGATLWIHLAQFSSILQWDSHVFALIGRYTREGLLPYRDLYDLKPPGIYYYLAGVFTALPTAIWSIRVTDFLLYICGGAAFYSICRTEAGRSFSVIGTIVWLYFSHHPKFDIGGVYTEEYVALSGIASIFFASRYAKSGRSTAALLCGLAAAGAALFKHPGAGVILPALVLIAARPSARAIASFTAGLMIPPSMTFVYFWAQGATKEFLDCNFFILLTLGGLKEPGYAWIGDRFLKMAQESWAQLEQYPVLVAATVLGVSVSVLRPTRLRLAMLLWMVIDFVGVAAENHYFPHHYIKTFPSICLAGTLGAAWLLQPRATDRWFLTLPRAAACILTLLLTWPTVQTTIAARRTRVTSEWKKLLAGPEAWPRNPGLPYEAEIGSYVRERTSPGDRIHVHGWNGTMLGIYWVADRKPASRYFFQAPFADRKAQALDLESGRPEYVVLVQQPRFTPLTPWLAKEYSVEAEMWKSYPVQILARNRTEPLRIDSTNRLAPNFDGTGLSLAPPAADGGDSDPLARASSPRWGEWVSPVVRVRGNDGRIHFDWNPRNDLTSNRTGADLPRATASASCPGSDVRAVLGFPTATGSWASCRPPGPDAVSIDLGFPAIVDRIVLEPLGKDPTDPAARFEIEAAASTRDSAPRLEPLVGSWSVDDDGNVVYRFAPQVVTSIRVSVNLGSGLQRVRVLPTGMGITAYYRTGPTTDLSSAQWRPIDDREERLRLDADRYVQIRMVLRSDYRSQSPVLRSVEIGRIHFEGLASATSDVSANGQKRHPTP